MSRISNGSSIVSLVDRSVGYGILGAGARMGAGLVTVSVVALTLTKEEQGFFFTFFSVLGLRVFVELGLGQVLVQFASHEFAKLRLTPQQGLEGDAEALSRLTSLGRSAIKWFFCGTFVFVVVAVCAGGMFFDGTPSDVDWLGPWVVLCGLTGLRILLTPIWSILEGCNRVEQIYRFRFFDVICSSVALWVALGFGVGLWALVASTAVGVTVAIIDLLIVHRRLLRAFVEKPMSGRLDWWREVWPMQWRIAGSILSNYFIAPFWMLVIFKTWGPETAGQMGLTWSLVSTIGLVAALWTQTKAPTFGIKIARLDFAGLDKLFFEAGRRSAATALLVGGALFACTLIIYGTEHEVATRILDPTTTAILVLAQVISSAVAQPIGVYLRAHKKEPLFVLSVVSGAMTAVCTVTFGVPYGPLGIAWSLLVIRGGVLLPWVIMIFRRCRSVWHPQAEAVGLMHLKSR